MKGKFPLFVLNISLPSDEIDVNVHPSKMEIKFRESKKIYDLVYSAVLQTLSENNTPLFYSDGTNATGNFVGGSGENSFSISGQAKIDAESKTPEVPLQEVKGGFSFGDMQKFADELSVINVHIPRHTMAGADSSMKVLCSADYEHYGEIRRQKEQEKEELTQKTEQQDAKENSESEFEKTPFLASDLWKNNSKPSQVEMNTGLNYKLVGRLFNTYVLIEIGDNFIMIDQHAGHERVLFDKFTKMFEEKKMIAQPLMVPYVFEVNEEEKTLVEDNLDVFSSLGFEVEGFGNKTYKISSIPALLDGINLEEFVQESLQNLTKVSPTNEQIKNHFATCACKAAVKGGQNLSDGEIEILLEQISKEGRILQCPHGRPVCIKFSKYEIEKMFKRIVS